MLSVNMFESGNSSEGCYDSFLKDLANGIKALSSLFDGSAYCAGEAKWLIGALLKALVKGKRGLVTYPALILPILFDIFCPEESMPQYNPQWPEPDARPGPVRPNISPANDPPCFAAGTPVTMADGSRKPIEEVRAGDEVLAFDGKSDTVKRVYVREADHVRELWYRSEEGELRRLETTDEHLLWVDGKDWIPARKVEVGDNLMSLGKLKWKVEKNERFNRPATVYSFDVHTYRSYFAGGVLAHERCGTMEGDPVREAAQGSRK
jgi:hypothetical protein